MMQLVVALFACLLLQPTQTSAGQRRERTVATAAASDGAAIAAAPGGLDASLGALTAWRPALDGPPWQAAVLATPSSAHQVLRLWLVAQRLLC